MQRGVCEMDMNVIEVSSTEEAICILSGSD